jgi:hypothetical protein
MPLFKKPARMGRSLHLLAAAKQTLLPFVNTEVGISGTGQEFPVHRNLPKVLTTSATLNSSFKP